MADRPLLSLRGLAKSYGPKRAVLPLDLDIAVGDFFAILGPSGCGKTTLLRMIGGFVEPTQGRIEIDGADVTRLPPERRPTNMVFQGYGLFPHMTVRQNIAYGPKIAKWPKAEIDRRVDEIVALGRLGELADRGTHQLSGGQQQRVALARALVMRPKVLLLDEPLSALDLKLRQAMQDELRRLHREIGGTFVFVTHDQGEALGLANRIAVMEEGELVQEGGPEEIYAAPRTRFVSAFIGEANFLPGLRAGGTVALDAGPRFLDPGPDGRVSVMVRPEAIRLGDPGPDAILLSGTVRDRIFLGPYVRFAVALEGGGEATVHLPGGGRSGPAPGDPVRLGWSPADQRVIAEG